MRKVEGTLNGKSTGNIMREVQGSFGRLYLLQVFIFHRLTIKFIPLKGGFPTTIVRDQ